MQDKKLYNIYDVPVKVIKHNNIKILADSPEQAAAKAREIYSEDNAEVHVGMAKFHSRLDFDGVFSAVKNGSLPPEMTTDNLLMRDEDNTLLNNWLFNDMYD